MGANVSSQTVTSVSSTTNTVLNKLLTSMINSSTSGSYSNQDIFLDLENANCKNIYIFQTATNELSALSQLTSQNLNDLSNELKNSISKDIAQAAKQENTGLNLGQVNASVLDQVVSDYLDNNIKNEISTSISNIISNTTRSDQKITIYARNLPYCDSLKAGQSAVIKQISSSFAQNIVENTLKNVATNADVVKLKQESDQKNAGISLFGGIILLVVIGVFVFFFKTIMKYIIPIFMLLVGYGIYYFQSTNQTYSMIAMIIIEVLLFILEIYCIVTARNLPNLPKMPNLPNLPNLPKMPNAIDISIKKTE